MQLQSLFSPQSIAIIGASSREGSVGSSVLQNIIQGGFSGKIYPVNPKSEKIQNLPCFASVSLVPDEIDLAIIIVPAALVPGVLTEVGEKNIPAAIIISSGFKETGGEGALLEEQIRTLTEKYRIALLGPNCLGFLHPKIRLNASFAKKMPTEGEIAFFSQSGALCTAVLDLAEGKLGFSHFVSIGNKAALGENELLRYFAQDEETKVIGFYSEGLTESQKIIETGRAILSRRDLKPIIALKSGTTTAGTKASSSHTGALAGSDAAYQALFRQARITRAESLEHFFELFSAFAKNPLPQGKRVAIITNAGGLGVLATDKAIEGGLELATLSEETKDLLRKSLPAAASVQNPVDVLGDALTDRYESSLTLIEKDPGVDMILIIVTPQTMTEGKKTAEAIINFKKHSEKPYVAVFSGRESLAEGTRLLEE
ncbi:MAG: CoA-binding protein, partial [Patescibacteria group bacterium]